MNGSYFCKLHNLQSMVNRIKRFNNYLVNAPKAPSLMNSLIRSLDRSHAVEHCPEKMTNEYKYLLGLLQNSYLETWSASRRALL